MLAQASHQQDMAIVQPNLTELPQPLLELILIKSTSTYEKKCLRRTCKLFQRLLDDSLVCMKLEIKEAMQPSEDRHCLMKLLHRIRHKADLETVVLGLWGVMPCHLGDWPKCLNGFVKTLMMNGHCIDFKDLKFMPCLTSLHVQYVIQADIKGLEHISGLTSLHCDTHMGSLAHLAPTLRRLKIHNYDDVEDLYKLTNLEVLDVRSDLPTTFFQEHRQLPLKHLAIKPSSCYNFLTATAWESAPTSLTRLTLDDHCNRLPPGLPASITHLQLLLSSTVEKDFQQAAAALPGLRSLDVSLDRAETKKARRFFSHVSKFTNLQSLGVCVWLKRQGSVPWDRETVLKELPEVAMAVNKCVSLNVVASPDDFLGYHTYVWNVKSAWNTHA